MDGAAVEDYLLENLRGIEEVEKAGAVLLVAAGYREEDRVSLKVQNYPAAVYWTSTGGEDWRQWWGQCLDMTKQSNGDYLFKLRTNSRDSGYGVRMIGPGPDNQ